MTSNYTAEQIRDAARVLYAMTPGTRESEAAHMQMLEWAGRVDPPKTAGQAAYVAACPAVPWDKRHDVVRERWEKAAAAAIEFAAEPTEMAAAPGPLKVGDTVLILPRVGQENLAFHVAVVAGVLDARVTVHVPGEGDDVFTVHRDSLLVRDPDLDVMRHDPVFVPKNALWGTPPTSVPGRIAGYSAVAISEHPDTDGDMYVERANGSPRGYVRAAHLFPTDEVDYAVGGSVPR